DVDASETAGRSYDYQEAEVPKSDNQAPKTADNESGRLIISPIAARMAAEAGINLKTLQGSGPGGRIIKRDIETAVEKSKVQSPTPKVENQEVVQTQEVDTTENVETVESQDKPVASNVPTFDVSPPFRDEATTQMRRTIAIRLTSSIGPVPHFFLTVEIEMDEAAKLRKQINGALPEEKKVSLNDVIIKVVANALIQHPQVNASFQDKNLRFYERADIGVAVAVPDGLITPVIRGANYKGIAQIASEVKELAGRAKSRKLKPEEYTGATFSISNLGMFGIEEFTAVINPPEAAILAIGTAENKAVVRDNEIVIRNIMRVTLSCDHRVIDGVTGSKFLQSVKQMLENPILLLM
ncbi:MAG: 2-oxo acid dehydrogenase subunit E2, partial [Pyrinomonadaceae bacterium]|nr:2-oxo acid dehydrogenase subunit E2 [Pyrinomonadaceae bacterium]